MKIIPVMDLLDGNVVHGVAGKRNEYMPIDNSVITDNITPFEVANDFSLNLGLNTFYLADLNLIQKTENLKVNLGIIHNIVSKKEYSLMLDGGCTNRKDVIKILELGVDQVIIGTETLASLSDLDEIVDSIDGEKIVLSIDLKGGKLLTNNKELKKMTINELIEIVDTYSLYAIIILDLHKVGSQSGPMNNSLKNVIKMKPTTDIITGGGVRNLDDLIILKENNISGALVATAFHKGKITKEDLELLD